MRSLMSLIDAILDLTPDQQMWLLLIEAVVILIIVEIAKCR